MNIQLKQKIAFLPRDSAYQRKWRPHAGPLCTAVGRSGLPEETTYLTDLPAEPCIFFNKSCLFGHCVLSDSQDITVPSQEGGKRKLGDVYSISVLGNWSAPVVCHVIIIIWAEEISLLENCQLNFEMCVERSLQGGLDGIVEPYG